MAYQARHPDAPAPVASPQDFTRLLVERLNQVRQSASLRPLALCPRAEPRECPARGDADRLRPGRRRRSRGPRGPGPVGRVAGARARSERRFLRGCCRADSRRECLAGLRPGAPDRSSGSAGPAGAAHRHRPRRTGAMSRRSGAVVTTYALFDSDDHGTDESRFFRAHRGVPQETWARPACARGRHRGDTRRVRAGAAGDGVAPMPALQAMMRDVVARTGKSVKGYVLETNDLERVQVPDPLLGQGSADCHPGDHPSPRRWRRLGAVRRLRGPARCDEQSAGRASAPQGGA